MVTQCLINLITAFVRHNFEIRSSGLAQIRDGQNYIFAANHLSFLDGFAIYAVLVPRLRTRLRAYLSHRCYKLLWLLAKLLIGLSEHWDSYRVFDWAPQVPWSNNGTQKVIGWMKACPEHSRRMRNRAVPGYKTLPKLLNGLLVAGSNVC